MALTSLTETIDDTFVHTWYEIRPEAIDNILSATPVWAALRAKGCFKTQVGGRYITRTVKYGEKTAEAIGKGDVLAMGEDAIETMGMWTWRYMSAHVQRSLMDDQQNSGRFQIKSLVSTKTEAAIDALKQKMETRALAAYTSDESGKEIQGLEDMIPLVANKATGTYGKITRNEGSWWVPQYKALTAPKEVNLIGDMENLFNTIGANMENPDLIVSDQGLFELYKDFALDIAQIAKAGSGPMADLGFETVKFRGADMIWSANQDTNHMLFLNTDYIDVVYDPQLWFESTGWKVIPRQTERIMHIISALNIVSSQLRRHGRLYAA